MQQAGAAEFAWQALDHARVRGRRQADHIYTVRGPADAVTPPLRQELAQWDEALALWRAGDVQASRARALDLARQHPSVALYALHAQRCAAAIEAPQRAPDGAA